MATSIVSTGAVAVPSATSITNPLNLSPALPATRANGDMLLLYTTCRSATPTVATPAGWTLLANVAGTNGRLALFALAVDGTETAPTVTWSGTTTGNSGSTAEAQITCIRGLQTSATGLVDVTGTVSNTSASTSTATGGNLIINAAANTAVISLSTRLDDTGAPFTAPSGMTLIGTGGTATGADMSMGWAIQDLPTGGGPSASNFGLAAGASSFASSGLMVTLRQPSPTTDTFSDDFDDNSFDTTKWTRNNATGIVETGGVLQFAFSLTTDLSAKTVPIFDFTTGAGEFFAKVTPGNASLGFPARITVIDAAAANIARIEISNNALIISATGAPGASLAYNPINHAWLKIKYNSGIWELLTSASGVTGSWVLRNSVPATWTPTGARVELFASGDGSAAFTTFDSVNVAGTQPVAACSRRIPYAISAVAADSARLPYKVLGTTGEIVRLPYAVKNTAGETVRLPYKISALTAATRRLPYALAGAVAATRRLPYVLRSLVGEVIRLPYSVRALAGTTAHLPYKVVALAGATRRLPYSVIAQVKAQRAIPYTVFSLRASTRRLPYSVFNTRTISRAMPFKLVALVAALRTLPFNVFDIGTVFVARALPYSVRTTVAKTVRLPYSVRSLIASTRRLPYGIRQFVAETVRMPYVVAGFANAVRRLPYGVVGRANATRRLPYSVRVPISSTRRLPFKISILVASTRRLPYSVRGVVSSIRRLPFKLTGIVSAIRSMPFKVFPKRARGAIYVVVQESKYGVSVVVPAKPVAVVQDRKNPAGIVVSPQHLTASQPSLSGSVTRDLFVAVAIGNNPVVVVEEIPDRPYAEV